MALIRNLNRVTTFRSAGGYSPEAQAAISRYSGLTSTQSSAVANFVDTLTSLNQWDYLIEFFIHGGLGSQANSLISLKTKTASVVGVPIWNGNEFVFDGIDDALNLNINLSTTAGITASDISFGAATGSTVPASGAGVFSARTSGTTAVEIFNNGNDLQVNAMGDSVAVVGGKVVANNIYHTQKTSSGVYVYKETTLLGNDLTPSTSVIPSDLVHVGARSSLGSLSLFYAGAIKASWVGQGLLISPISFITAVRQLLTDLGI